MEKLGLVLSETHKEYVSQSRDTDYLVVVGTLECKPIGHHVDTEDGVEMEDKSLRALNNVFAWF